MISSLSLSQTEQTPNGATESHFNGSNTAASVPKDEGNVAMFASNEHGLNFLSESEVECKPQTVEEPPAPVENECEEAPPESSGFSSQGADEGWVEQGGEGATGDQGEDMGKCCATNFCFGYTAGNDCFAY